MLSRIHIQQVGQCGLLAIADGSDGEQYHVGLDFTDLHEGELGVHCDCPRFAGGDFCKHLWATISKFELLYPSPDFRSHRLSLCFADTSEVEIGPPVASNVGISDSPNKRSGNLQPHEGNKQTMGRRPKTLAAWKSKLQEIAVAKRRVAESVDSGLPTKVFQDALIDAQHWFVIPVTDKANQAGLEVVSMRSTRKQDGSWSRPVGVELSRSDISSVVCKAERAAMALLLPKVEVRNHGYRSYYQSDGERQFSVQPTLLDRTLLSMHMTGRLAWKLGESKQHFQDSQPISELQIESPYRLSLSLQPNLAKATQFDVIPKLRSDVGRNVAIDHVIWCSDIGCALIQINRESAADPNSVEPQPDPTADPNIESSTIPTRLIKISPSDAPLIRAWQKIGTLTAPRRSIRTVLKELSTSQSELPIETEPSLQIGERIAEPTAKCILKQHERYTSTFDATLFVIYDETERSFDSTHRWWFDENSNTIVHRDLKAEADWLSAIPTNDFDLSRESYQPSLQVKPEAFLRVVETLQAAGWEVTADGAPIRVASDFNVSVSSGVDWFDLTADVEFDGISASLPMLLEALRKGDKTIVLDDGSQGMLPTDWLKQFVGIRDSGQEVDGAIRFRRNQALLLDAMLQEQAEIRCDRSFSNLIKNLKAFEGVDPVAPPKTFQGTLRDYQKLGLGWFEFLQKFGFGGCLADDMGLGKTIQVLALLDKRRTRKRPKGQPPKPSIVVVPKSLVFNWMDEAAKFTPKLRLLNYTGTDRKAAWQAAYSDRYPPHLIITTYGTLRNDASILREHQFDYAILDEAQAIKNPKSLAAKATRLLQSDHRLVMTGTPIENHLGDLWSLFDFLNPGMLDSGIGGVGRTPQMDNDQDRQRIDQIGRSLRPFILRRTKEEVLTELPEKVEQTLSCEMGTKQRKLYDELREHYRIHLSNKVKELGLKRSKIHVLEALLRLRQAACDPRLVRPDCGVRGTKIDNLLEQLAEVIGEGHKALVFSQFTSLLGLLRADIEQRGWDYEYLDGKTRKRSEKVHRFQNDEHCQLFLISLKAGGNGLNLTAADYVFILDPWWNPAVEAQAIDRAHRMGQTKSVNAYRMICSNTVEEKIIDLQQSKRDLADAIICQDKSLISGLTADDLQSLLG